MKRETDIKTQGKKALSKWMRAVHSCTVYVLRLDISRQRDRQWLWFSDWLLSAPDVGIFCQLRCSYLPGFAAVQKRKRSAISPAEFLEIVR